MTIRNVYLPYSLGITIEILLRLGLTTLSNVGMTSPFYYHLPNIILRWLRTSCRWRTPVRSAVLRRTPSEGGALGAARPTRRTARGCRPYRCGDRPGGSQPPVCQRTMLPLQETRKSYHISPPDSSAKRDFLKFRRRSPCQSPTYAPCAHTLGSAGRLALPLPLVSVCDFVRAIISFRARRVPRVLKLIKKPSQRPDKATTHPFAFANGCDNFA